MKKQYIDNEILHNKKGLVQCLMNDNLCDGIKAKTHINELVKLFRLKFA